VVYGGAEVGDYLANHPQIETLHVTGSDKTYDAIVWGTDKEEQKRRKAENDRKNMRQFSAELGCVTPILVVPGPWSESDLEFQARHVAAMVAQNASFNCNAAKILVTSSSWIQRKTFLAKVHEALKATRARKAYYPGAQDRYKRFIDRYPQAQVLGEQIEGAIPWTAIPDVPAKADEFALNEEAFCGVLAEVTLEAEDEADFFRKSVAFANDECWGTLSIGLLVHPATMERFDKELDRAIADLRYGGIAINAWPGVVYALVTTTWGAYPGHPPTDIRSGTGVVHNALLFDHPQKSVVFAPFRIRPKPVWFADHKNLAEVGRRLLTFEMNPSWGTMFSVATAALKG
jgi:acyl-CoA reductase-like NAD-dependent aldehyde dehydrogenase